MRSSANQWFTSNIFFNIHWSLITKTFNINMSKVRFNDIDRLRTKLAFAEKFYLMLNHLVKYEWLYNQDYLSAKVWVWYSLANIVLNIVILQILLQEILSQKTLQQFKQIFSIPLHFFLQCCDQVSRLLFHLYHWIYCFFHQPWCLFQSQQ